MGERIEISPRLREAFEQHVAERCAPLVAAAEGVLAMWSAWVYEAEWEASLSRLRAALRAFREGGERGE